MLSTLRSCAPALALAVTATAQLPTPTFVSGATSTLWRASASGTDPGGNPAFDSDTVGSGTALPVSVSAAVSLASASASASLGSGGDSVSIQAHAGASTFIATSMPSASIGGPNPGPVEVLLTCDAPQGWAGYLEVDWQIIRDQGGTATLSIDVENDGSVEFSSASNGSGTDNVFLQLPAGTFEIAVACRVSASASLIGNPPAPSGTGSASASLEFVSFPASSSEYGDGCPEPSFYEQFFFPGDFDMGGNAMALIPNGGRYDVIFGTGSIAPTIGSDLELGDDDSTSVALGFAHPVPGYGDMSTLVVGSNGVCGPPGTSFDYDEWVEYVPDFLANPVYAVCWDDFSPNQGGAVYFGSEPATAIRPYGRAVATWSNVPQYGQGNSQTFQIVFYEFGPVVLVWETNIQDDALVGFSSGLSAVTPSATDLSASPGFTTGLVPPLRLEALTDPIAGTDLDLLVTGIAPTASVGVVMWGSQAAQIPLDILGAPPGCSLLTLADIPQSFPVDIVTGAATFPVQPFPGWVGQNFFLQAVVADFALPYGLPVVASNGLQIEVGS